MSDGQRLPAVLYHHEPSQGGRRYPTGPPSCIGSGWTQLATNTHGSALGKRCHPISTEEEETQMVIGTVGLPGL
jgi:hypothetical protein